MTNNDPNSRPPCPDAAASVTCADCVEFLLDYLDGVLPEAERLKFESHVAHCRDCQVYLDNYRKTMTLTAGLARDERIKATQVPGEGLIEAILRIRKSLK